MLQELIELGHHFDRGFLLSPLSTDLVEFTPNCVDFGSSTLRRIAVEVLNDHRKIAEVSYTVVDGPLGPAGVDFGLYRLDVINGAKVVEVRLQPFEQRSVDLSQFDSEVEGRETPHAAGATEGEAAVAVAEPSHVPGVEFHVNMFQQKQTPKASRQ